MGSLGAAACARKYCWRSGRVGGCFSLEERKKRNGFSTRELVLYHEETRSPVLQKRWMEPLFFSSNCFILFFFSSCCFTLFLSSNCFTLLLSSNCFILFFFSSNCFTLLLSSNCFTLLLSSTCLELFSWVLLRTTVNSKHVPYGPPCHRSQSRCLESTERATILCWDPLHEQEHTAT